MLLQIIIPILYQSTDRIIMKGKMQSDNIKRLLYNTEGVKNADKGKFKEAVECFTKAIDSAPRDSLGYFNRATVKINLGDISGARTDFALSESYKLIKSP